MLSPSAFFFFFLLLFLCFCKRLQPPQSNSVALSTLYVLPLSVQCLELCPTTFLEQIGTHKFAQQWERSRCTACFTGRAGVLRRIYQCKQSSFLKALILQTSFLLKIWMDQRKKALRGLLHAVLFFHQRNNFFFCENFFNKHLILQQFMWTEREDTRILNLMTSYYTHYYRWKSFLSFKVNCIRASFLLSSEIQYFSPAYQISCQIHM